MSNLSNNHVSIGEFISENNLVYTDFRYDVTGKQDGVADVLQLDDDNPHSDVFRRLLIVDTNTIGNKHDLVWGIVSTMNKRYIIPKKVVELSFGHRSAYQLPTSARSLQYELIGSGMPRNLMGNDRIAASLGSMVGTICSELKMLVEIGGRVAIVDFLDEDVEPVMLIPRMNMVKADAGTAKAMFERSLPMLNKAAHSVFMDAYTDAGGYA